jgi:uncharacterized membrane protein HdeD (DUF308 family)
VPISYQPVPDVMRARIADAVAGHWKRFLVQRLILELLGVLAFTMPLLGTLAVDILLGWLLIIGGVVRVVPLVRAKHLPEYECLASGDVLVEPCNSYGVGHCGLRALVP